MIDQFEIGFSSFFSRELIDIIMKIIMNSLDI